jgi:hypothetical protein
MTQRLGKKKFTDDIEVSGDIFADNIVISSSPVFSGLTIKGIKFFFESDTIDAFQTEIVTDPTDDRALLIPDVSGTFITTGNLDGITSVGNNSVILGTSTDGDYVASIVGDSGVTVSGGTGEGSTPTISLTNSSITVNGTSISLGDSETVTADANTLTGTELNPAVVNSSLTSVGTVDTGVWQATAIDILYGGTGATTAENARSNLGLSIGSDVQAYDTELAALAGLTSAQDKLPYFTGSGTADLADLTSFGRSLIDDSDASSARTTLGLTIGADVQAYNNTLANVADGVYTGDDSITTLGTISNGVWQGSSISTAHTDAKVESVNATSGTGVTVSSSTGAVVVSIGQSVASTDSPQFAGATLDAVTVGVTASNEIDTTSGNLTIDSSGGTVTVDDNLIVTGDFTVQGSTINLEVANLNIEDNIITLNFGVTGTPTLDAGIEVERGSLDNVSILWNESEGQWEFTNDGNTFVALGGGGGGSSDLGGLTDVDLTSVSDSDILVYENSSSSWVNQNFIPSSVLGNSNSVASIEGANTVTANDTAVVVDTTPIAGVLAIEYLVRLTQGSKRRLSKVIVNTNSDETSVNFNEFAIIDTGASGISGVSVTADVSSNSIRLLVSASDAASTNIQANVLKTVMV